MAYAFKTLHSASTPQAIYVAHLQDPVFLIVKHSSLELYSADADLQCLLIQPLFASISCSSLMTQGLQSRLAVTCKQLVVEDEVHILEFREEKFHTILSKAIGMAGLSLDWSLKTDCFRDRWYLGTGSYHDFLLLSSYDWNNNELTQPVRPIQVLFDLNCCIVDWTFFRGKALALAMYSDSALQKLRVVDADADPPKELFDIPLVVPEHEMQLLFPSLVLSCGQTVLICYENSVVVELNPLDVDFNWNTYSLSGLVSSYCVGSGRVVIATDDGVLYQIEGGHSLRLGEVEPDSCIAVYDELVLAVSYMGDGVCFDTAAGKSVAVFPSTGPILDAVACPEHDIGIDSVYLACGGMKQSCLKKASNGTH
jgi:hypothetical protein